MVLPSRSVPGRRSLRERKFSQKVSVVDDSTKAQVAQARLDALENDREEKEQFGGESEDDEFVLEDDEEEEVTGKRRRRGRQALKPKKFRSVLSSDRRGPKTLARLLEEANLSTAPGNINYLTAAAGPPTPRPLANFARSVVPYPSILVYAAAPNIVVENALLSILRHGALS
eukprot:CAMPEP_0175039554 /NCGR_PEP_ID=MMETSP0052_2-20121109/663_1 /TAXON_ID=51329 ORGANISM="Polytomella parva, Strain SAG 63-3" /NCGR_SAMPLE_ID=MMETSP0052_2 /ASSEMBLY_ACC=CAM_ASM_000194 /LENGTH=171 /DNA_ID=CAMNT_0016301449 /DNA_START=81 /DNA_END=597 /DNA_ORIENTATION=-